MTRSKILQSIGFVMAIGFVMIALKLMCVIQPIGVFAAEQKSIVFDCTEFDSVRGETFTTTVYAQEGSNVTGLDLTLTYDSEYVSLISYNVVEASEVNVSGNNIEIHYADADNVVSVLNLVQLTFGVDDNLANGLYPNWLTWSNSSTDDAFTTTGFNNGTPQYEDLIIETAFPALFIRQQGDAYNNNYDGKVNARDASYILQHAAHMFTMPVVDQKYANVYTNDNLVDGTAKISARDASLILQYAAHMDVTLSDRVNVTFYALDESGNYTVQVVKSVKKGSDLTRLPTVLSKGEGKEGLWSASANEFKTPDFTNITEAFNVYAHYADAVFSITYDFNGKQGVYVDDISNPSEYTEKDAFELNNLEDVPGYKFAGWYNNVGDKVTEIVAGTTGDITFTAKWTLEPYTITYDLGNATNSPNNVDSGKTYKTYTIESKTFTLASPTLAGYHFVGWLDENGNLVKQISEGSTGDIHLTPKWSGVTASIVPYAHITSPIYKQVQQVEQTDGKVVYIYYLGYIANVPTGTADISNIKDWQGVGTWELKTEETNATTSSTTTYGKVIASTTTNWENGLAEKVEIKAESSAFGGAVKGSVSGSVEAHQSWGQNITGTHESGQDVVKSTVNEELTCEVYKLDEKSPVGFYWYSVKTTVDVFALVEYDPTVQTVTYDTARVWRDAYTTGWTYATSMDEIMTPKISGDYDDFCFEVPDSFFVDISKLSGGSKELGLIKQENGTECSIVAYEGNYADIVVPTYLDGKKVTSIKEGLFANAENKNLITSVTFGKGITSIPDSAFEGCVSLNKVVFYSKLEDDKTTYYLTSIGAKAFKGCTNLKFDIPNSVTTIGDSAFDGCKTMESVTISDTVTTLGAGIFKDCCNLKLTVNSGNFVLIQTAVSSGATSVYVNWKKSDSDVNANCTLTVSALNEFTFNGNNQKFNNLRIVSDSTNTIVEYVTIRNNTGDDALVFSSTDVNLRAVDVTSNKSALTLSGESVNLILGSTVTLTAQNGCAGVNANELNVSSAVSEAATLNVYGGVGNPGGNGMTIKGGLQLDGFLNITVTAGAGTRNGDNGANGGVGISANNILVNVSSSSTITVTGGTGGAAYNRSSGDNDGDRSSGRDGFTGGSGGIAIAAGNIKILSGELSAKGGVGGRGGDGSECNYAWNSTVKGGRGGNGGIGAIAIQSQTIEITSGSLTAVGGKGGDTGRRGGCHNNDHGDGKMDAGSASDGSPGTAGSGAAAISADCIITGDETLITESRGENGTVNNGLNQC